MAAVVLQMSMWPWALVEGTQLSLVNGPDARVTLYVGRMV